MVEQVVGLEFITQGFDQSIKKIDRHTKSVDGLTGAAKRLQTETTKASNQLIGNVRGVNQYGKVLDIAGKTTNRFGMQLQQAGYQVGDFFVQVQGGTNVAVAFGQQMSQLLGVLGAGGAIAGAGVAIATAIIAPLLEMQRNAADAKDQFEKLSGAIREYIDASKSASMSTNEMNEKFGQFSSFARSALLEMEKIKKIKLDEAIDAVANSIDGIDVSKIRGQIPGFVSAQIRDWLELNNGILKNNQSVFEFVVALQRLQNATGVRNQLEAADNLSSLLVSMVGDYEDMNEQQRVFFEGLQSLIEELSQMKGAYDEDSLRIANALMGDQALEAENIRKNEERTRRELIASLKNRDSILATLQEELILSQTILKYGKDSEQVSILKASNERAAFMEQAKQQGIIDDNLKIVMALYDQNVKVRNEIEAGGDGVKQTNKELEEQLKLEEKISEEAAKRNQSFRERTLSLENENRILERTLKYGKDSAEVQKELNSQAQARLVTEMMAEEQSPDRIIAALRLLRIQQDLTAQIEAAEDESERIADEAERFAKALDAAIKLNISIAFFKAGQSISTMNSRLDLTLTKIQEIIGAIGSIGFETIAIKAETRALRAGKTAEQAAIEGQVAQRRSELEQAGEMGPLAAAGLASYRMALEARLAADIERRAALRDPRRQPPPTRPFDIEVPEPPSGGTGDARQEDYLSQLQKEAELKLRLIGLTDEQRRYEEIAAELSERGLPVEEQRIQAIIATEQALQQATNAEERRQDIMQAVTGNIETALMGLVEGTSSVEDAFKSMMRNIILEVYRQQVAKPFADAIGSFFFANGAAFQGGNVVPFANGGVVGGPTTFPMSGGRTGLMGEAGPEAIMPLKRGKDGKLGVVAEGGGAITQNLVFNISANGDDSVKRIVQQQIPRIAEATKAAVVDAKRRGGAYGKAFA